MKRPTTFEAALVRLEQHAETLMEMPTGEQFVGATQSVIATALLDVKMALEALASEAQKRLTYDNQ
jgi:hypothetical protein